MSTKALRKHLVELLEGGHAHLDFETAIADLPVELRGAGRKGCHTRPGGCWSTCGSPSGTSSGSRSIPITYRPSFPPATGPKGRPAGRCCLGPCRGGLSG